MFDRTRIVVVVCLAAGIAALALAHDAAPSSTTPSAAASPTKVEPLFSGLGPVHHPVSTKSALAQQYFDQGLALDYAFNHEEALRSFQQAARIDPNLAMAFWGEALVLGPNYNLPMDPDRAKQAYEAIGKAKGLEAGASDVERAYIDALAKRYSNDPKADSQALQTAYANAMRELWHQHPDDLDAGVLFAESLMDLDPWKLWTHDGAPSPGTDEIVATLEEVIKRAPNHPGANHYYIHAVEASPNPGRALPEADRLGRLCPNAGHLVHMPTHIYMRVGRYHDVSEINAQAAKVDEEYIEKYKPAGTYPMMYYPHNIAFMLAGLMMEGRSKDSIAAARKLASLVTTAMAQQMPMAETAISAPYLAMARYSKWDDVLNEPFPSPTLKYAIAMWHYCRGLAFVATDRLHEADIEQQTVAAIASSVPGQMMFLNNSPRALLMLAAKVLQADVAAASGKNSDAIRDLGDAVKMQDELNYSEPPDWYFPVRESLGALLLKNDRAADAEAVFREDLRRNPNNGWSLNGLARSLRAQHKDSEAAAVDQKFKQAWAHADTKPTIAPL